MDFMRFCAFRVPDMQNMEDIIKCMDSHVEDLCPPCRELVQNATSALQGFHAACDASLTAQCPDAIGKTRETGRCIVEHLADLEHGCLGEISKLMMMKMRKGGRKGPHPGPHGPPMDGFSTGIGSEEFDVDFDFFGPSEEWSPGHRRGPPMFAAGMAGEGMPYTGMEVPLMLADDLQYDKMQAVESKA